MAPPPREQDAITAYLREGQPGDTRTSILQAVVGDARTTFADGKALWLATAGYLIAVEQIGHTVARAATAAKARSGSRAAFVAAVADFGSARPDEAHVLYDLRCALAHQYGLGNKPDDPRQEPRVFGLTRSGAMVVPATTRWDRTIAGSERSEMTTFVNINAVRDFVEQLVQRVKTEHGQGQLVLVNGVTPDEVVALLAFSH